MRTDYAITSRNERTEKGKKKERGVGEGGSFREETLAQMRVRGQAQLG